MGEYWNIQGKQGNNFKENGTGEQGRNLGEYNLEETRETGRELVTNLEGSGTRYSKELEKGSCMEFERNLEGPCKRQGRNLGGFF